MGLNLSHYTPPSPPFLVGIAAAHSGALDLAAPLPGVIPSAGGSGSGLSTGLPASPLPDPSPAWLAELLGVAPAPATAPLVLASALPPIPGRAVEKISKGQFIDFKELLNDNIALVSQLRELGAVASSASSRSRLREVTDPLTWVYCYLSFMAVLSPDARVRDLVAYAQIIVQLARSHGGSGWLAYDRRFRQQLAAGTPLKWNEINPSLLSATVLGAPPFPSGRSCPLCLSWDHTRTDCALASLSPQSTDSRRTTGRQRPYWVPREYCRRFNSGSCPNSSETCRFLHACSTCGKSGHPASECKEPNVKKKAPTA